nr:reverse transcriptase domain-containing protein [Tanacetum cinerariifolium]
MSTRSSARNLVPPLEDPERTIRRRNSGDPALLINFEEINMANNNQNNHDQPLPEGPIVPAPDLQTMEELCQPTLNGRGGPITPVAIQANDFGLKHHMIQQCMSTRSSARNLVPPLEDPERTVRRRNSGDLALLINFEEINMANNNQNNHDQPLPEGPIVPGPDLRTMEELIEIIRIRVIKIGIMEIIKENNQGRNQFFQGASQVQNPNPNYQALAYQAPIHQPQIVTTSDFSNYIKANDDVMKNTQTQMTSLTNSNIELKNMFGTFMKMNTASTSGSRPLPSNTIANSKGELKAITTRNSVSYEGPPIPPPFSSLPRVVERVPEVTKDTVQPSTKNIQPLVIQTRVLIDEPIVAPKLKPTMPYPSRMNKQKLREKDDKLALKFLEIFRKLHFELSFADASLHMPKFAPIFKRKFHFLTDFIVVDYVVDPRVPLNLERPFLRTGRALIDVYGEELTLRVDDEAITFKVGQTLKYFYNDAESINQIDVIDVSCEEYFQEVPGFSEISKSGNPTPILDPIVAPSSSTVTPFGDSGFLLEETDAFLAIEDDLISPDFDDSYYDSEGDIRLLKEFLNDDPSSPLLPKELKFIEPKTKKSSIDELPELELKDLPSHLKYAFLDGADKLPVIIVKNLKDDKKAYLLKVLKSHKRAIA